MKKKLFFLDTETTGLNSRFDDLIEIACVKVNILDTFEVHNEDIFHTYLKPSVPITEDSKKIHGISEDFLQDKPTFSEIYSKFLEFISDGVLVAHNAPFDISFLNEALNKINKEPIKNKIIDSLVVARRLFKGQAVGLDRLPKLLGINFERGFHSALEDAMILAKVYSAMMRPKQQELFLEDVRQIKTHSYTMLTSLIE
jgi:DNA polymerase-3 subunit epsilon